MSLFGRQTVIDPADPIAAPLEAYKEGRRDERRQVDAGLIDRRIVKREIDEAYDRGRQIGAARRRGSLLGALSFVLLAILVIGVAILVVSYGSFGAAGAAIDQILASI